MCTKVLAEKQAPEGFPLGGNLSDFIFTSLLSLVVEVKLYSATRAESVGEEEEGEGEEGRRYNERCQHLGAGSGCYTKTQPLDTHTRTHTYTHTLARNRLVYHPKHHVSVCLCVCLSVYDSYMCVL